MHPNSDLSCVCPRRGARGPEVLVGADEHLVVAAARQPALPVLPAAAPVAPGQRADEVTDPVEEITISISRNLWTTF